MGFIMLLYLMKEAEAAFETPPIIIYISAFLSPYHECTICLNFFFFGCKFIYAYKIHVRMLHVSFGFTVINDYNYYVYWTVHHLDS